MSKTIDFYHQNAQSLSEQYQSLTFEQVHKNWQAHWPTSSSKDALKVHDIGAGAGRDDDKLGRNSVQWQTVVI